MSDLKLYTSGYMKPPKHSQFKKGKSGNLNGRPKQSSTPDTALQKALKRKVAVTGEDRKIRLDEALIRRLRDLALSGDRRAIAMQQKILEMGSAFAPTEEPVADVMAAKERLLKILQKKQAAQTGEDGDNG